MFTGFYETPPWGGQWERAAQELAGRYPFMRREEVGRSLLGRCLYGFTLGAGFERVLYVGAVHGAEWLTGLLLYRFLEDAGQAVAQDVLLGSTDLRRALEKRRLTVIPVLNPDGVEIAIQGASAAGRYSALVLESCPWTGSCYWQANARGVDLNHNFDAGFPLLKEQERAAGYTKPGPTRYGGQCPHSEPESAALVETCRRDTPVMVLAFHAQGEEIYYDYPPYTPKESGMYAGIFGRLSGYEVCQPQGLASHGGFKDWFVKTYRRPGFTFEIGKGKNPLPITDLPDIYARLRETMAAPLLL